MSYIFPRRRLRSQDVLDPIELTLDLSPAAERLSGRLNAHNFNENIASSVDVEPEAVTDTKVYSLAVPFGDLHPATAIEPWTGAPDELVPAPGTANEDAYRVQNTFEWQAIADHTGATAVIALTTGSEVLWVHAFAQLLWYGFYRGIDDWRSGYQHASHAEDVGVNLQFALRLDGNIVEDTITGIDDVIYQASIPVKPLKQRDTGATTVLPGPHDARGQQICAVGPAAYGPRISACLPVQAGEHTVEIVVRRVPLYRAASTRSLTAAWEPDAMTEYTSYDNAYIFSRQIIITQLKIYPVDSAVSTDISVPSFEEEDPISNTTMYVQRVQPLMAAYNDVAEGNLQRGALMHYHLPPVLRAQDTERAVLTTAFPGEVYNCVYPGFNSATIASAKYDAATPKVGWFLITDGTQDIMVKNINIAQKQRLLTLANLEIVDIKGGEFKKAVVETDGGPVTIWTTYCGGFAVFRLMWRISGTGNQAWQPLKESTSMVNSYAWLAESYNQGYEFAEVMLQSEFQIGPLAATTIDIAAFGAVMNVNDPVIRYTQQKTEFYVKRGSILTLSLRD